MKSSWTVVIKLPGIQKKDKEKDGISITKQIKYIFNRTIHLGTFFAKSNKNMIGNILISLFPILNNKYIVSLCLIIFYRVVLHVKIKNLILFNILLVWECNFLYMKKKMNILCSRFACTSFTGGLNEHCRCGNIWSLDKSREQKKIKQGRSMRIKDLVSCIKAVRCERIYFIYYLIFLRV